MPAGDFKSAPTVPAFLRGFVQWLLRQLDQDRIIKTADPNWHDTGAGWIFKGGGGSGNAAAATLWPWTPKADPDSITGLGILIRTGVVNGTMRPTNANTSFELSEGDNYGYIQIDLTAGAPTQCTLVVDSSVPAQPTPSPGSYPLIVYQSLFKLVVTDGVIGWTTREEYTHRPLTVATWVNGISGTAPNWDVNYSIGVIG